MGGEGQRDREKGIRPRGITMRSNVVNINETKVISVFLFFSLALSLSLSVLFLSNGLFEGVGGDEPRDY